MYQADPADAVKRAARHLRPGGVVAFAEINMPVGSAVPERAFTDWPPTPASEQVNKWMYEAFAKLGTQPDMGTRLLETFAQAGLEPSPNLETEFAVVVGEDAISHTVEFLSSLLPAILGAGIATEEEVDIDRSPSVCVPAPARLGGSEAGPPASAHSPPSHQECDSQPEQGRRRTGSGRVLYQELFKRVQARGYRMAVAGMTLPNEASVGLHWRWASSRSASTGGSAGSSALGTTSLGCSGRSASSRTLSQSRTDNRRRRY